MEEPVTVSDGTRLVAWTSGDQAGLPPVVLLHGGPGMWDYLRHVLQKVLASATDAAW